MILAFKLRLSSTIQVSIHSIPQSVLQQTVAANATGLTPDGDLLASLQTHHRMAGQQSIVVSAAHHNSNSNLQCIAPQNVSNVNNNNNNNYNGHATGASGSVASASGLLSPATASTSVAASLLHLADGGGGGGVGGGSSTDLTATPAPQPLRLLSVLTAVKKQGVSGESSDSTGRQQARDIQIPTYEKDFRSKQLIKEALMDNDFLKNLDSSQVREIVDSMYGLEVRNGEYVIREGEAGAHLFVSAVGEFEVIQDGTVLGKMGEGKAFGELAILYNCTRTASIKGEYIRIFCKEKPNRLPDYIFKDMTYTNIVLSRRVY